MPLASAVMAAFLRDLDASEAQILAAGRGRLTTKTGWRAGFESCLPPA